MIKSNAKFYGIKLLKRRGNKMKFQRKKKSNQDVINLLEKVQCGWKGQLIKITVLELKLFNEI